MEDDRVTAAQRMHYDLINEAGKHLAALIDAAVAQGFEVVLRIDAAEITTSDRGAKHVKVQGPQIVSRFPSTPTR